MLGHVSPGNVLLVQVRPRYEKIGHVRPG